MAPRDITQYITRTKHVWHLVSPSVIFRIQMSLRRQWGFEVVLLQDLPAGTTLKYGGTVKPADSGNGFCFALRDGTFLDGLDADPVSIGILFNDDWNDLVPNKATWTATEDTPGTITYTLEEPASAGDICCVAYGDMYFTAGDNPIYVDFDTPDIVLAVDNMERTD